MKRYGLSRILYLTCVIVIFLSGCRKEDQNAFQLTEISDESVIIPEEEEKSQEISEREIYVDVSGQVRKPGVYMLLEGNRVFQAIERAGGLTEEANISQLNQAQVLSDGQKIYIPSKDEVTKEDGKAADANDGKININTAGVEELMTLSGIGKAKAEAIIRYREEQGHFSSIDEIQNVEGIKEGTFQKLKDQITV